MFRLAVPVNTDEMDNIKVLAFDVFGTCVNWRATVERQLKKAIEDKLHSPECFNLPSAAQSRAREMTDKDWAIFAQQWRTSYMNFTHGYKPGMTEWKDIDSHHYESLALLLQKWHLDDLFSDQDIKAMSLVWHFLDPWPDSAQGICLLGTRFITSTLSNGNQSLLRDLDSHNKLGFQHTISAADFKAYKPNKQVYLGAASKLKCEPAEMGMVAAHLGDLAAARECGMKTIYVERPGEEDWCSEEDHQLARGWVDMWVDQSKPGFLEVAKRFGLG